MNDRRRPTDPAARADFAVLEAALADLAGVLDVAATPDIAGAVRRRIADRGAAPAGRRWWPWRPVPRAIAIAFLILLILAAVAAAAIGFGLPGLRFVFVDASPTPVPAATAAPPTASSSPVATGPTPTARPSSSPSTVDFGEPATLASARDAVDFRVYVPAVALVGPAEPNVFLDRRVVDGLVILVYPPDPARPLPSPLLADGTGRLVGIVITESRGSIDEGFLQKGIGPGTTVQPEVVNGRKGWWIAGRPHTLNTIDAAGDALPETLRDIGDVLAWVQGGTLIRIESPLGLAETMRIAESMQ